MNLNKTGGEGRKRPYLRRWWKRSSSVYNETDTPTIGCYVFWHSRATDVVLIGPFRTLEDASAWWEAHGKRLGVHPMLTHLRSPAVTYNGLWGLMPEEESW
jgi:hypothetical protein